MPAFSKGFTVVFHFIYLQNCRFSPRWGRGVITLWFRANVKNKSREDTKKCVGLFIFYFFQLRLNCNVVTTAISYCIFKFRKAYTIFSCCIRRSIATNKIISTICLNKISYSSKDWSFFYFFSDTIFFMECF